MIIALILGALIGFLTQVPVGPINAAVITHGLSERFSRGFAIGVGAAFMDFIYCAAAMFGVSFLNDEPVVNLIFQVAGFIVLIIFGIKSLRTKKDYEEIKSANVIAEQKAKMVVQRVVQVEKKVKHAVHKAVSTPQGMNQKLGVHGPFLFGLVIYLSNPSFLPYWIGVSGILQKYHLLHPTPTNNILFALGVGIGSAGWFYLVLMMLLSGKITLKPSVINGIYKFSGVVLLGFGAYVGYRLVFLTEWDLIFHAISH